jgi:mycothiol synthase
MPRAAGAAMICHEILTELDGADLRDVLELVQVAWDYDEQAGFTRITEAMARQVGGDALAVRHVIARGSLDDRDWDGEGGKLIAYVHLAVDNGQGVARVVVHPDFRSRGVATMLVETLGLDTGGPGWLDSGAQSVTAWAWGHHPAAQRLARRFELTELARTWLLQRHLTGPFAPDLPAPDLPAPDLPAPDLPAPDLPVLALPRGVTLDSTPAEIDATTIRWIEDVAIESGMSAPERHQLLSSVRAGRVHAMFALDAAGLPCGCVVVEQALGTIDGLRAGTVSALVVHRSSQGSGLGLALLVVALRRLTSAGAQVALMRMNPHTERAVRLVRRLGFERQHDDACYGFGRLRRDPSGSKCAISEVEC